MHSPGPWLHVAPPSFSALTPCAPPPHCLRPQSYKSVLAETKTLQTQQAQTIARLTALGEQKEQLEANILQLGGTLVGCGGSEVGGWVERDGRGGWVKWVVG